MRRPFLRRLFTPAAAVSAVLCVGACVMWVRSDRTVDLWYRPVGDGRGGYAGEAELWSQGGKLRLNTFRLYDAGPAADQEGRKAMAAGVTHLATPGMRRLWTGVPSAPTTA